MAYGGRGWSSSTPHDQQGGARGQFTRDGYQAPSAAEIAEIRRIQRERRDQRYNQREARRQQSNANQPTTNANINTGPSATTNGTNNNAQNSQQQAPQSSVPPSASNVPNGPNPTQNTQQASQGLPKPPHGRRTPPQENRTSQDARCDEQQGFFNRTFNAFNGFFSAQQEERSRRAASTGGRPRDYHGKTAGEYFRSDQHTPKGPQGPKRPYGSNNIFEPNNLPNLINDSCSEVESLDKSLRMSEDVDHQFGYEFQNYSFADLTRHNGCKVFEDQDFSLDEVIIVLAEYGFMPQQNAGVPDQWFRRARNTEIYACQLVDLMEFKIARARQIQHDMASKRNKLLKALNGDETMDGDCNMPDLSKPPPGYNAETSRLSAEALKNHNAQFSSNNNSQFRDVPQTNNAGFNSNNFNQNQTNNAGFNSNNFNQNQTNNAGLNSNNFNQNHTNNANANLQPNPFVDFQRNNNRVTFQQDNYAGLASNNTPMQFSANSNLAPITINGIQYVPTYSQVTKSPPSVLAGSVENKPPLHRGYPGPPGPPDDDHDGNGNGGNGHNGRFGPPVPWGNHGGPGHHDPQHHYGGAEITNRRDIPGGKYDRPQFHGTTDKFGPIKFLERLHAYLTINKLSWLEMYKTQLRYVFQADARAWILPLLERYDHCSYSDFEQLFKKQFLGSNFEHDFQKEVEKHYQEQTESACAFVRCMLAGYYSYKPQATDAEKINTIINNTQKDYIQIMVLHKPTTTYELLTVAEIADTIMKAQAKPKVTVQEDMSLMGEFTHPIVKCSSRDKERRLRLQTDPRYLNQEIYASADGEEPVRQKYMLARDVQQLSQQPSGKYQSSGNYSNNKSQHNNSNSSFNSQRTHTSSTQNGRYEQRNRTQSSDNRFSGQTKSDYVKPQFSKPYPMRRTLEFPNASSFNRYTAFNADRNFANRNPSQQWSKTSSNTASNTSNPSGGSGKQQNQNYNKGSSAKSNQYDKGNQNKFKSQSAFKDSKTKGPFIITEEIFVNDDGSESDFQSCADEHPDSPETAQLAQISELDENEQSVSDSESHSGNEK